MSSLAERIRERRRALGLTIRALGASARLSPGYLSRVERGVRTPSTLALRSVAAALATSVHWLETGEEDPAEELARLVLGYDGRPLPGRAHALARVVLATPDDTSASG